MSSHDSPLDETPIASFKSAYLDLEQFLDDPKATCLAAGMIVLAQRLEGLTTAVFHAASRVTQAEDGPS